MLWWLRRCKKGLTVGLLMGYLFMPFDNIIWIHHANALPPTSSSFILITHNSSHMNSPLSRIRYHINLSIILTNHTHLLYHPSNLPPPQTRFSLYTTPHAPHHLFSLYTKPRIQSTLHTPSCIPIIHLPAQPVSSHLCMAMHGHACPHYAYPMLVPFIAYSHSFSFHSSWT